MSWLGTHLHGRGSVSTVSAVLQKTAYGFNSHAKQKPGTSPPELIAAAHAGSFSIALADELGHAGYRPSQIDTTTTVTMENIGT
ncbi:MAG TPA: hypothetical protein VMZ27_08935, partial [Candidatus Saccharimonadales bacterium]|nr:hypothetical protein [Candidatus Saccharimonadales bacterium]